jgi:hypothetical protein
MSPRPSTDIASNRQKRARPFSLRTQPQCVLPDVKVSPAPVALGARTVSTRKRHSENLGLIIAGRGVKPAVVMKTLSRIFALVVLVGIAIVAVVSCCNFPFPSLVDTKSRASVEIGHDLRPGTTHKRTYVKWKSQDQFNEALRQVCDHHGMACVYVLMNDGDPEATHPYKTCNSTDCRLGNMRTVKVTKSKVADDTATGGSAVNDPHVTMRVASAYPGDIIKVLDALQP